MRFIDRLNYVVGATNFVCVGLDLAFGSFALAVLNAVLAVLCLHLSRNPV